MSDLNNRFRKFQISHLQVVGIFLLILISALLLWFNTINSYQATSAMVAQVYFDGEYRIGDEEWHKIVEGEHIPTTKGDVTLRGNFHMLTPDGEYVGIYRGDIPIAFYVNHINLTFYEGENEPLSIDTENPLFGKSICCANWVAHFFTSDAEEEIEIVVHNPHSFGNETAIDEMLSSIALWSGMDFEKDIHNSGETQREIGLFFVIISLMLLGIALFSLLIHIKNTKIIWMLGPVILFAGIYFVYSSDGISFWSESTASNTTLLGSSMILYMLFVSIIIVSLLKETKKLGNIILMILSAANGVFFVLPIVFDVFFYDTWVWWGILQLIVNIVLMICLAREFILSKATFRWIYLGVFLPLIAFDVDIIGIWRGLWSNGVISQCVFIVLFVVSMIMMLKLIPHNINVASKAKELEMERIVLNAELAETRISTMISQIRPHFIYNTLGSIEQLCLLDPPKAGELVHNFAKYLRGNFGELDNPKPILMSREMEHVHYYISIEKVRFPDMTFTFEMNCGDFHIPALTVQPIVENAIKHGLMKLPRGGTIRVVSYETDTDYCISVVDDGVGFDTSALFDDRKHLGIRNIRERLKVMVGGKLEIESAIGEGTKVLITIPKEVGE